MTIFYMPEYLTLDKLDRKLLNLLQKDNQISTKILAEKWARQIESDIDSGRAGVLPKGALLIGALIRRPRGDQPPGGKREVFNPGGHARQRP